MAKGNDETGAIVIDPVADNEAWLKAAASRKYRIDGGLVWSGVAGMLFPLPPVPGFANLSEAVQPMAFHGIAQFVTYRVGQTATGNVAETVGKALTDGTIPTSNTNDAFEAQYTGDVADRIEAKYGEPEKTAEAKAARRGAIAATAKKFRPQLFDSVIAAAKEAALNKAATGTGRKKRAASTDAAMEIDA